MNSPQLLYQIALTLLPEVGIRHAKQIVSYFGSAQAVFEATEDEWKQLIASEGIRNKILSSRNVALKRAKDELAFVERNQIDSYFYGEEGYPYRLMQCSDAPVLLYAKGNLKLDEGHFVSIVGTRMPSDRGKDICRKLVFELAERLDKLTIVSGLAYGIDVTAQKAAIEADIPTIIIPGHGLDMIYPALHRPVAVSSLKKGGILTEYMSRTRPDRQNFIARNRIIAGLSDATVVVESKSKGGSLITADMAFSYGRDVFAFPGRITDECSAGCNSLIKRDRARLIESADDLIMAMQWDANKAKVTVQTELFTDLTEQESKLLAILRKEEEGLHVNLLTMYAEMAYSEVTAQLLQMEFKGLVKSLPGGIYRALK